MFFDEPNLNDNILDALYDMHFEECTPVQEKCIPHILDGRDIIGVAQTGTGKTAAYLLPVLSMLDDGYADFPDGRSFRKMLSTVCLWLPHVSWHNRSTRPCKASASTCPT